MNPLRAFFRCSALFSLRLRGLVVAAVMVALAALPVAHACPSQSSFAAADIHAGHDMLHLGGHGQDKPVPHSACGHDCCLSACINGILPVTYAYSTTPAPGFVRWPVRDELKRGFIQRVATPPPRLG